MEVIRKYPQLGILSISNLFIKTILPLLFAPSSQYQFVSFIVWKLSFKNQGRGDVEERWGLTKRMMKEDELNVGGSCLPVPWACCRKMERERVVMSQVFGESLGQAANEGF